MFTGNDGLKKQFILKPLLLFSLLLSVTIFAVYVKIELWNYIWLIQNFIPIQIMAILMKNYWVRSESFCFYFMNFVHLQPQVLTLFVLCPKDGKCNSSMIHPIVDCWRMQLVQNFLSGICGWNTSLEIDFHWLFWFASSS